MTAIDPAEAAWEAWSEAFHERTEWSVRHAFLAGFGSARGEADMLRAGIEEILQGLDGLMSFEVGSTPEDLRDLLNRGVSA